MKNTILILIAFTIFSSCKKKIILEGYLIDERTGAHFNPYSNATVRLVLDQSYGYTTEVGSATVDENGYFMITGKNKKLDVQARLELKVDENYHHDIYGSTTLQSKMHYDFIIACNVNYNRTFKNQLGTSTDSTVISITNSKGTKRISGFLSGIYHTYYLLLKGQENNYIDTRIYSNGTYTQKLDTIYSDCKTTINDTLIY